MTSPRTLPLLAALLLGGCMHDTSPDIDALEAALKGNDSATAALEGICRDRRLADPPVVRAERIADQRPATDAERQLLGVGADEPLHYRHVRLVCGTAEMEVAHNWYVPARLATEMNRTLDTTDTPFGRVVAPLGFHRERLELRRGSDPACPAGTVLVQRGILRLPDGRAISLVIECFR
jgi:hypothetical protein